MQLPIHEQVRMRMARGLRENTEKDEAAILDALGRARQPVTPEQLAHEVGMEPQLVRTRLREMSSNGISVPNLATDGQGIGEAHRRRLDDANNTQKGR